MSSRQSNASNQSGESTDARTDSTGDPSAQLDVLGDECSRTILVATCDEPKTAKELTARTDCSSATVYRRINDLLDGNLLEECVRFEKGGSHTTAYRARVDHVSVEIDPSGIDVDVSSSEAAD